MARYDYKCTSCGNVFEVEHPMSETPEVVCPSCGAPASKTFSASGIKFEGSGFYNTDQRSGGSSTSATSGFMAKRSSRKGSLCSRERRGRFFALWVDNYF